jgi:hypothetical protein
MATASAFFAIALGIGHGQVSTSAPVLTLVGFVALTGGGWLGGAINYVHGMRVFSLPDEPVERAVAPVPHDEKVEAAKRRRVLFRSRPAGKPMVPCSFSQSSSPPY